MGNNQGMRLKAALELYYLYLRGERATPTLRWYERRLSHMSDFLGNVALHTVSLEKLWKWRAQVIAQNWRPWTKHGYVRAARTFWRWCHDYEHLSHNPAARLKLPKLIHEPKSGIADDDMRRILKAARGHVRDYALLCFVADTACRAGGVVNLTLSDLMLDERRAVVNEKGGKGRTVHMTIDTVAALRAWLDARPACDNQSVFVSQNNQEPLTYWGVYLIFKRRAKQAGVQARWNPHEWRHGASRAMLRDGASLGVVSRILGHSSIQVTDQFYGSFDDDYLHEAHAEHSWMAKKKTS